MLVTKEFFGAFSAGVMLLCCIMAAVWIVRIRTRGLGASFMAIGSLLLGALAYALQVQAPFWVLVLVGIGLAACLVADFLWRISRSSRPPQ